LGTFFTPTYIELPLGYAAAEKVVTFIFGMVLGSNPSTHWQSDFAAASLSRSKAYGIAERASLIVLNMYVFGRHECLVPVLESVQPSTTEIRVVALSLLSGRQESHIKDLPVVNNISTFALLELLLK
jgi:hypothetical protein